MLGAVKRISIKQRLWVGFSGMMLLSITLAVTALLNMKQMRTQADLVIYEIQPTLRVTAQLSTHLRDSSQYLSFFLLGKEQGHLDHYRQSLALAQEDMTRLQSSTVVAGDSSLVTVVGEIEQLIERYQGYDERMQALVSGQQENLPAQEFATEVLNPINVQISQLIAEMLVSEEAEVASIKRKRLLKNIADLRYNWANVLITLRSFLAFRDLPMLSNIELYKAQGDQLVDNISGYGDMLTFEQADAMAQIADLRGEFFRQFEQLVEIHSSDRWRTDAYLMKTEVAPLLQEMESRINAMADKQTNRMNAGNQELLSSINSTTLQIISLLGAALLVGGFIAFRSTKQLGQLVTSVQEGVEQLSDGNLAFRMNEAVSGEQRDVARLVNGFSSHLNNVVRQLSEAISRLHAAAAEMTSVTAHTNQGIQAQYEETEQVATAISEMSGSIQDVARNAVNAAESVNAANEQAGTGAQLASNSITGIKKLLREVESAASVIQQLHEESESIGTVLDVIRGIAEQTNLLALNAAIEAARAGEQGRGFAVVADEVRTLAKRTQDSTQEIQRMIEGLQSGATSAVGAMEEAKDQALKNTKQVEDEAASLRQIASSVSVANDLIAQIACAAEEQGAVAKDINNNVMNISNVADQTAEDARHTQERAHELDQLADELNRLIGKFRVA